MSLKYGARLLTLNKFQKLSSWSDRSQNHCSSSRYLLFHTSTMASGGDVKTSSNPNRLIESKSPYLLQHAYNPVDWFPWGEEAFAKAREEQKLVFLSVGYSTCHWCHVMEKESFENKDIAKIMNNDFVCIKVDREERPDVDKIYMTFIQAISGRGGWPMSVFMTPELHPVFGGTYYPPDDRYYGQPGFGTLLKSLAEQWKENPAKFRASGDKILSILKSSASVGMASLAAVPDAVACATRCFGQLRTSYEPKFGGFSERPKFPQPVNLGFLLRWHVRQSGSQDDASAQQALDMVVHTLRMMAKGGIFDHISLGFARYSTDDQWHVPHFEKMLYDQAQLVSVYTDAYLVTGEKDFARVAHDVLDYVERCLTDPSGGFYSAEDADSYPDADAKAKREGAFCVWTRDEIQSLLGGSLTVEGSVTLADLVCHHFDIRPEGNVDPYQDPHDELKGKNVPIIRGSEQATAAKLGLSLAVFRESLKSALSVMRKARLLRPPPHLDDKMLAAWNGLMISAFAKAGAAFLKDAVDDVEEAEKKSVCYVQRAIKAAAFLRQHLFDPASGRLIRSCYRSNALDDATRAEPGDTVSQNAVPIFGFLDDYAFVIRGLLDLYASCQDQEWLQWADQLQQKQDELFWDTDSGGYFTSAVGDVSILVRLKEDQDGAEPSGNSVSAGNLVRLAVLVDRIEYEEKAGRLLRLFSERLAKVPISLPEMLSALVLYNDSPSEVLIVGPSGDKSAERLFRESLLHKQSVLGQLVVRLDDSSLSNSFLAERRPSLEALTSRHGKLVSGAYLCRNRSCSSTPITSVQDLRDILDQNHQPHTTA